jgi:hypothetical protein
LKAKEPETCGGVTAVKNDVCNAFKFLPLAFGIVLVLIVRLTLPIFDDKGTKDVKDILADFDLGTVTNELVHGTTRTNDVL